MGDLSVGTILDGRWRIGRKIGEGACAKVYDVTPIGKDSSTIDFPLVAKVIALPKSGSKSTKDKEQRRLCDTLYHEYNVCVNNFHDLPYVPRRPLRFYGESEGNRYLVMEKLDRDLLDVAKRGNSSVQDVAHFGLQILDGLKLIHQKGYFFIDIKPDNFMLKGDKLFFVDFGLVERRPNSTSAVFGANDAVRSFAGTATYASIDALNGKPPTVSDEIQSMVYVLLAVLNGGILPWSAAKSDAELLRMKKEADLREFSNSLDAGELAIVFQEACESRVDYNRIESLLRNMLSKGDTKRVVSKSKARAPVGKFKTSSNVSEIVSAEPSRNESPVKRKRGQKIATAPTADAEETINLVDNVHEENTPEEKPAPIVRKGRSAKTVPVVAEVETSVGRKAPNTRKGKFGGGIDKARAVASNTETKHAFSENEESEAEIVEVKKRKASRSPSPVKKRTNISATVPTSEKRTSSSTKPSTMDSGKMRKRVIQNEVPFSPNKSAILVDPEDILGFEDGMPTYLNACLDDVRPKPKKNNASNLAGPFSMRKSEYHRHRLSSFGGDSVDEN